jgi:isopenicillin N synthase-like dioxygenase
VEIEGPIGLHADLLKKLMLLHCVTALPFPINISSPFCPPRTHPSGGGGQSHCSCGRIFHMRRGMGSGERVQHDSHSRLKFTADAPYCLLRVPLASITHSPLPQEAEIVTRGSRTLAVLPRRSFSGSGAMKRKQTTVDGFFRPPSPIGPPLSSVVLPKVTLVSMQAGDAEAGQVLRSALQRHGACIVTMSEADAQAMYFARLNMLCFTMHPFEDKEATRVVYRVVGNGQGHMGFNKPSSAKENFRVRLPLGDTWTAIDPDTGAKWAKSGQTAKGQPAPLPVLGLWAGAGETLREPFVKAYGVLDALLQVVLGCVVEDLGLDPGRFREMCCDATSNTDTVDTCDIGPRYTESVLDLFHYNNTDVAKGVPNLNPHFDPGLLTAVPCAQVAGLQVQDRETQGWIPVEEGVIIPTNPTNNTNPTNPTNPYDPNNPNSAPLITCYQLMPPPYPHAHKLCNLIARARRTRASLTRKRTREPTLFALMRTCPPPCTL